MHEHRRLAEPLADDSIIRRSAAATPEAAESPERTRCHMTCHNTAIEPKGGSGVRKSTSPSSLREVGVSDLPMQLGVRVTLQLTNPGRKIVSAEDPRELRSVFRLEHLRSADVVAHRPAVESSLVERLVHVADCSGYCQL